MTGRPVLDHTQAEVTAVSPIVKAAAVQMSPVLYSRQGTVERVLRKIRELGQQGVQFATFPETVVPYYPYFSSFRLPYRTSPDPSNAGYWTSQ